jgi:4-hydroxybenzoyl-CoA thioesterase
MSSNPRTPLAQGPALYRSRQVVRFGDVDHAGVVYFVRFFHFCHIAYEDWFGEVFETPFARLFEQGGFAAPVVGTQAAFRAPLRHGERFAVDVSLERFTERAMTVGFRVLSDDSGKECARIEISFAAIDLETFAPAPFPEEVQSALRPLVHAR